MFMLAASTSGFLTALLRAAIRGHQLAPPELRLMRIMLLAFAIQWSAFGSPVTRSLLSDHMAALALIISMLLLLSFAWANRRQSGFWALILGITLNILVIAANGGFMPISPETLSIFAPEALQAHLSMGERIGFSKDVLLPASDTIFWFLSDRFFLPVWLHCQVAFSLGDVFIAWGAFWALCNTVRRKHANKS